ncbi:putative transmembrane protein [Gregarina niphandrodes]|uniref:Transmembrane protein n=1 Tax=Gregarina niphandrodes TaxID=110365 RepID=A0A023BDR0_GRENI|nr:putative transmembrane protein [Gregarina niphandrodes]EZG89011.1 putative transmembrane protein [Gregarina niphandrodes]|eukprot:XP_011128518.1 putative transmembrane protein [Gregarina niphandrodes]
MSLTTNGTYSAGPLGLIVGFILGYHRHEQNMRRRRVRIDSIDSSGTGYDHVAEYDLTSYGSQTTAHQPGYEPRSLI